MGKEFYARVSKTGEKQLLKDHLEAVAEMASKNADKIGLKITGEYIGLRHDNGKYQKDFQEYVLDKNKKSKRGDIDHSTAGAQISRDFFIESAGECDKIKKFIAEIVPLCIASHHSGLIDMLDIEGENKFCKRMTKEEGVFKREVLENMDPEIRDKIKKTDIEKLTSEVKSTIERIRELESSKLVKQFYLGMIAKFLLSCLIDADHTNSADFELGAKAHLRQNNEYVCWNVISERLEKHVKELNIRNESAVEVKQMRKKISDDCFNAGKTFAKGCYKLEVPTGGGKTLASFRFAVEMAKRHSFDRIIYCIPYTTIIEQNADTVRKIVEKCEKGRIVIEHHSNLIHKNKTEEEIDQNDILTENWDARIIFTTNVQFLETLFGGKTSNTRRLHQLANSVIIFDEIQTLPIKCVHMFNNAVNFLVDFCGSSVVLCTATQPLLDGVCEDKGKLKIGADIVKNKSLIFDRLERVEIINKYKNSCTNNEIAEKAVTLANENDNCLVVCNTTKSAKEVFEKIQNNQVQKTYYLSARMIPIHRKWILRQIKRDLNNKKKIIVVSTQVIEAGIDIDFNCGIRALAGLDSIFQAAGRINRNGNLSDKGKLYVYNFEEENIQWLKDIYEGKKSSKIVLSKSSDTVISTKIMDEYYEDYFYQRKKEMQYLCEHENSLLDLLSENSKYKKQDLYLKQSFKKAAEIFKPIDNLTKAVCLCKGKARRIISKLDKSNETLGFSEKHKLIKELQKYSLNIYCEQFERFKNIKAIDKVSNSLEIFYLDKYYYDNNFGITEEATLDKGGTNV